MALPWKLCLGSFKLMCKKGTIVPQPASSRPRSATGNDNIDKVEDLVLSPEDKSKRTDLLVIFRTAFLVQVCTVRSPVQMLQTTS